MKLAALLLLFLPSVLFCQYSNKVGIELSGDNEIIMYASYDYFVEIDSIIYGDSSETRKFIISKFDSLGITKWVTPINIELIECFGPCSKIGFELDTNGNIYLGFQFDLFEIDGQSYDNIGIDNSLFAIIKIDPNGIIQWHKIIHTDLSLFRTLQIKIASNGDAFVTVPFRNHIEIDGFSIDKDNDLDSYIGLLRITPDGQVISLQTILSVTWENVVSRLVILTLEIDSQDNLYAAGNFMGNLEVNSESYTDLEATSPFICKLTPDGEILWFNALLAPSNLFSSVQECYLSEDDSTLFISGYFRDSLYLTPTISIQNFNSIYNSFLLGYNPSYGNLKWYKTLTSARSIHGSNGKLAVNLNSSILAYDNEELNNSQGSINATLILDENQIPFCLQYDSIYLQSVILDQSKLFKVSDSDYIGESTNVRGKIILTKSDINSCQIEWEKEITTIYAGPFVETHSDEFQKIAIIPNPANEYLYIKNLPTNDLYRIIISDLTGKPIESKEILAGENKIYLNSYIKSGLYIISILGQNKQYSKKIIINNN